ncbi:NAD-dependent epimerase/dehydratase family protein, partial [Lactiplantibacillus plantarum]|nr:NAD-dependent epimerase/dehydratase family protein [Lactiplantibacillus plantarum]
GSHTAKALAQSGLRPIVYDDFSNGHRDAVRWGSSIQGDVRDQARLAEVMKLFEVDAVIHFAGLIEVARSVIAPPTAATPFRVAGQNRAGAVSGRATSIHPAKWSA